MKTRATLAVVVLMFAAERGLAADWPQWQGPDWNAISQETGLLNEWPEGGPPLAWRIERLGGGYSAPSIAAGRSYGMSSRGDDEVIWCLSEADGNDLWVTRLGPALREGMPRGKEGPGCTPTVDGDRLHVLGLGGTLACLQAGDGKIIWKRSLTDDFGGRLPTWRYNESPLIDGDKIICTPGGADATLVALDKLTGDPIWKSKVPDGTSGGDVDQLDIVASLQTGNYLQGPYAAQSASGDRGMPSNQWERPPVDELLAQESELDHLLSQF